MKRNILIQIMIYDAQVRLATSAINGGLSLRPSALWPEGASVEERKVITDVVNGDGTSFYELCL